MTGALALVAALITSQIQTHPTGLKAVGLSHGRGKVRTVQILDKLYEQAGKPSLDLDFARYGDLHDNATGETSLVTFSRSAASSPGTYVGADGLIKQAAVNLALYSEQFDNPSWNKGVNTTVTPNATVSPDGKQTADRIQMPALSSTFIRQSAATVGVTHTVSVWAKAVTPGTNDQFTFQLGANSSAVFTATDQWQLFSFTFIQQVSSEVFINNFGDGFASDIYIWGAQLEEGSTATPYIRTTSQALAAPRFDHDPLTGESLGLLVEEARTNLLTDSETFSGYNPVRSTISLGSEPSPSGGSAYILREDSTPANSHDLRTPSLSFTSGQSYTFSVYAKPDPVSPRNVIEMRINGSATDAATFNISTGSIVWTGLDATASIVDSGNGWYRCIVTSSSISTGSTFSYIFMAEDSYAGGGSGDTYDGDGISGVYLWGAQLETGAFPSSYIPTAGTSLTRAADVATVEGTDFSSWYNASEGTILAKYRSPTVATRGIVSLDNNTANEAIALQSFYNTGTQLVVTDGGTQQVNTAASIITDDAAYTGVAGYKASDFAVATAGDVAIDVAGTIPTVDRMRIGVNQGGASLNGHIARLTYWPVRKENAVLDLISDPVANDDYQILVKTDNTGSSNNDQFTIPAAAGTYDVDWGDGTTSTGVSGAQTHTYPAAGQYVIRMDGITHYQTNNGGDKLKLLDVQNWGNQAWTSMQYAYFGASNMIMSATDAPDLSGVTTMQQMFQNATAFNQPIGGWDVSSVTDMSSMLRLTPFNQPIGDWDVSSVTDMSGMFLGSTSFNQPIDNWNVSSVTNIGGMFKDATAFNQPVGSWDLSSMTNCSNFMQNKTDADYDAANLDAIYNGWIANELSPSESINFGSIKYTAAGAEGKDLLERANATVAVSNAVDNGSGLVRLTTAAHGLTTGNKVFIKDIVGTTEANGLHTVTVIDATTIDLQGTTFVNAYTSGGTVRTGYGWTITDGGI